MTCPEIPLAENPGLVHMETRYRGWLRVELDQNRCQATWQEVDRVDRPDSPMRVGHRLQTMHRDNGVFGVARA